MKSKGEVMDNMQKYSILAVDDMEVHIDILVDTLGEDYEVRVAFDGVSALEMVAVDKPDLILLDIIMPGMDGYAVCEQLKRNPETRQIPIIFLTSMSEEQDEARGLALGAVDFVTKPFSPDLVKARVNNHLELKRHRDHLEVLVRERTKELALTQEVTIFSLASLAETRDPETGAHILRTQRYVKVLAQELRKFPAYREVLDDAAIDLLYKSAPLHDIGKVGVRDEILLKAGKLTEEEFAEMKKHALYGRNALKIAEERLGTNSFMHFAREIAYSHHEKWDGTGYPEGLSGTDIPLAGRLMAIADVYDALISKRVYKPPFTHDKAVAIIAENRGTHFDPDLVDIFLACEKEFRKIAIEFADSEEERSVL